METFNRLSGSEPPFANPGRQMHRRAARATSSSNVHPPKAYRLCDGFTASLIISMVVFTPWAFGTTQQWSIWTMNIAGYVLGILLAAKWLIRYQTGYRPLRWGQPVEDPGALALETKRFAREPLTLSLAALTLIVLSYILVGVLNSRATFIESERRFEYRDCIGWLPHSYDRTSSWQAFWMYAGLACFFWASRDWLLGKPGSGRKKRRHREEGLSEHEREEVRAPRTGPVVPARLRLLLWILCINGSLLALESILQRLSGTNKLLWFVVPQFNNTADAQFGPYSYRANAASYFNLVWPVALGFWLTLRHMTQINPRNVSRVGTGSYILLLPGIVLMAACPIISTTRGGTLIALANMVLVGAVLLWTSRKESVWFKVGACSILLLIVAFSASLGLKAIIPRFKTVFTDQMSRRTEIYDNALPIARDFPLFGTGAGTFGSMYYLYRSDPNQDWAAYGHDDWLETRISLGWLGLGIIIAMLAVVLLHWFRGHGIETSFESTATLWISVAGCLLHAKFDFPFQVYSILFLFLFLAAILSCVSKRPQTG